MKRSEPPLMSDKLLKAGEWWGSSVLLLRSTPPETYHIFVDDCDQVAATVEIAAQSLPGEPISFGPAKWDGETCERPITGHGIQVDDGLLTYASAETQPDEWVLCEHPTVTSFQFLVGVLDGKPVAVVAPRRPQ